MADWDKFCRVFSDALDIEEGGFTAETKLEEIEEWDSIGALSLIAEVDDEFDVVLSPNDLEKTQTVGDLFKLT